MPDQAPQQGSPVGGSLGASIGSADAGRSADTADAADLAGNQGNVALDSADTIDAQEDALQAEGEEPAAATPPEAVPATEQSGEDSRGGKGSTEAPVGEAVVEENLTNEMSEEEAIAAEAEARAAAEGVRQSWRGLVEDAQRPRLPSWDATDETEVPKGLPGDASGSWIAPYGWEHLLTLNKLLGSLPELQALIRRMGRAADPDAPLRRAPAQREQRRAASGVVRSHLQPAETTGITRSDGHLLLLPSELSLLALAASKPPRPGAAGARTLHRLRRIEASLLSYERSAWVEEPAETLQREELRPAKDRGPMICCLDTSRSMAGRREAVAKAALLQVLRQAERERRRCVLYAFSGRGELRELEVPLAPLPAAVWEEVLAFLAGSFRGGTDLSAALAAALARVEDEPQWAAADMLLVTDGEVQPPSPALLTALERLRKVRGLRVYGLLIAEAEAAPDPAALAALCDEWERFEALGRIPLRWRPQEGPPAQGRDKDQATKRGAWW